jgi:hypothetical protein
VIVGSWRRLPDNVRHLLVLVLLAVEKFRQVQGSECALCEQPRRLCLSHVIPEFMYASLYDEKHRFWQLSSLPHRRNRQLQKGFRERLLCGDCEQRFGRWERYARDVFFGGAATQPVQTETGLLFSGLEYKRLKLFLLSLIWRLGVTSVHQLRGISLGPYEEVLRSRLLAEDPGAYTSFPALVTALTFNRKHISDLIVPPHHTRVHGQRVWTVVICGFLFYFFVSGNPPAPAICRGCLNENGCFPVHISDIREIEGLKRWGLEIAAAERERQAKGDRPEKAQ